MAIPENFAWMVKNEMQRYPGWRYGQAVFNVVYDVKPKEANKYRGSNLDPFYDNSKADAFIDACFGLIDGKEAAQ